MSDKILMSITVLSKIPVKQWTASDENDEESELVFKNVKLKEDYKNLDYYMALLLCIEEHAPTEFYFDSKLQTALLLPLLRPPNC